MRRFIFLIYFLFTIQSTNAQNAWKSFWQLSCPEKSWVILHPFIANKARKITNEAIKVSNEMKKDSLLDGDASGGQVDAFRHAFWMALLSQQMCCRKAISLGKAHERGNYRFFKKGKTDEEGVLPDSVSGVMDIYNNQIGSRIGCENAVINTDTLKAIIKTAVLEGKMKIISKDNKGLPMDCNGNIIDLSLYLHRWNIPKCLVPSSLPTK